MMTSYAQNFEDVMLWRALGQIEHGFYIDIGAQDPVIDSVSRTFYEQGWRGVHVEPTADYAHALRTDRPDEEVLQLAIGSDGPLLSMFEIADTGLSTADASIAARHERSGYATRPLVVPCLALGTLLDNYRDRTIHWLKIDVEGMETSVLESWGASPVRPWILVIESTSPGTQIPTHDAWETFVLEREYRFAYFDGLNRFYVHGSHAELMSAFATPPNYFDGFVLSSTSSVCSSLNARLNEALQRATSIEQTSTARLALLESSLGEAKRTLLEREQHLALLTQAVDASKLLAAQLQAANEAAQSELAVYRRSRLWRIAAALNPVPSAATPSTAKDLLRLDGEPFVQAAYLALLGRSADAAGLRHHLEQLHRGQAKSALLVGLADSAEGRQFNADLPGVDDLRRKRRRFWLGKQVHRRRDAPTATAAAADAHELSERAAQLYRKLVAAKSSSRS